LRGIADKGPFSTEFSGKESSERVRGIGDAGKTSQPRTCDYA